LQTELPETGAQQEILKAEADRVLEYAKQYVEQVREQQRKWEELRLQQQNKMEEQEKNARALLEELSQLVTLAEAASDSAHYTAAPLAGDHELENVEVLRIAKAVEQAGKTAMSACSACADFLVQKRSVIEEAESIRTESTSTITALQPRIQAATRLATEALQRAKENKDRIARKVVSSKRAEKKAALFKQYDRDGDGVLNREEIRNYSKEEFGFDLPAENLDRICRQLCQGSRKGLAFGDFQLLKTAVGIAREEERGREQRKVRLEREAKEKEEAAKRQALVAERRSVLSKTSAELMKELGELEPKVQSAEVDAELLANEAGQLKVEDLKQKAAVVDAAVEATKSTLKSVQERIQQLTNEVGELPELMEPMRQELTSLSSKADMQKLRLLKAQGMAQNAKQLALHKAFAEYEALRMEVAAKLRVCIEAKGGKADDLFGVIAGGDDGELTKEQIRKFLEEHHCEIEREKLDVLFPSRVDPNAEAEVDADAGAAGKEDKESKADNAKATEAKSEEGKANGTKEGEAENGKDGKTEKEGEGEKDSKAGESAEKGDSKVAAKEGDDEKKTEESQKKADGSAEAEKKTEKVSEAAELPKKKKKGLISKDDFMRVVRIFYKVVKEIVLSDNLLIEQSGQIRRMELGEVMEVYQGPMLDPSVGVYRIHGRALKDGIIGWVTVAGNQGITFLLPGGNLFKALRPTPLTEELKDLEGLKTVRMLKEGDILEVSEWARTSASALGVTRVRAKLQGENVVGWATTTDKDGTTYLEAS